MEPTPMRYHYPGWELALDPDTPREHRYQVWAPTSDKARQQWQSAWQGNYGGTGGSTSGDSLESVLGIFPPAVAEAFRKVVCTDE